ncbi:MSP7-like protein [Plasmodium brasilianum]|uniref:MSP7-like protein n=1 Tax=Plasmodium brasilianum TaxID=5824 RepID=A0ACB9Y461_PLABR|nr:MSP7-like protein [Plasmodium brasilianum]
MFPSLETYTRVHILTHQPTKEYTMYHPCANAHASLVHPTAVPGPSAKNDCFNKGSGDDSREVNYSDVFKRDLQDNTFLKDFKNIVHDLYEHVHPVYVVKETVK